MTSSYVMFSLLPCASSSRPRDLPDMSQTYLLFQTLLLLFWRHSCMIWTKLTRTDAVFSRATSAVFFCAGFWIFRYAGKIPKNYIKNQRSGSFREAKGGATGQPGGSQEGAWRGPAPGRATCPPRWVPHPLVTYLGPCLFSHRGNVEIGVAFPIYAAEPPQPSVLLRRANLEAELASGEGEIIAIVIVITSPSQIG